MDKPIIEEIKKDRKASLKYICIIIGLYLIKNLLSVSDESTLIIFKGLYYMCLLMLPVFSAYTVKKFVKNNIIFYTIMIIFICTGIAVAFNSISKTFLEIQLDIISAICLISCIWEDHLDFTERKATNDTIKKQLRFNEELKIMKFLDSKDKKLTNFYKSYKEISIATVISIIFIFTFWISRDLNEWFSGASELVNIAMGIASAIIVNCLFTYFQVYCVDVKKSEDRWNGIRLALLSITDNLDYIFKAASYAYKGNRTSLADFNDELFNELYDRCNGSDTISYKVNNKEIEINLHDIINERIEKITKKVENTLAIYEPYMDEECIKLLVDLIDIANLKEIFNNGQPVDSIIFDGPYRKHSRTNYKNTKKIYIELTNYIKEHDKYS